MIGEQNTPLAPIFWQKVAGSSGGGGSGAWQRPAAWPDLDTIQMAADFDGIYLTYDLSKTDGWGWVGVNAKTSSGQYTIERGHIGEGGVFVADETHASNSNISFRQVLNATDGDIQLWRVSAAGGMTAFQFVGSSNVNASSIDAMLQPCVEHKGKLPNVTALSSGQNLIGTTWLERSSLSFSDKATSCSSMYQNCVSLQSVDCIGWDTSAVTSMYQMFSGCSSLHEIDCSGWDTSAVTTFGNMFNDCASLRFVDCSAWETGSVTTMAFMFQRCGALEEIDCSGWDTSAVTTFSNMFNGCVSLQSVDCSGWDTSAVTTFSNMFLNCVSLRSVDAAGTTISITANLPTPNIQTLQEYYPFVISESQNFSTATMLDVDSLLRIIDSLPEVQSATTLTLGKNKLKLTDDQIAIATAKGWTVA